MAPTIIGKIWTLSMLSFISLFVLKLLVIDGINSVPIIAIIITRVATHPNLENLVGGLGLKSVFLVYLYVVWLIGFQLRTTFDNKKRLGFRAAFVSTEEKVAAGTKAPQTTEH